MLSLTAGEYMKMAVTHSTHIFRLYTLLFVCVYVWECVCWNVDFSALLLLF